MSLAFAVIFVARINKRRSLNIQSLVDETLLFFQVYRRIPSRWSSRGLAPNVRQRQLTVVLVNDPAHVVLALVPSALGHRLLLTPHHALQCAVGLKDFFQRLFGKRIKLFQTHQGSVVDLTGHALFQQVVVYLAATENHSLHLLRIQLFVTDHRVEMPFGQIFQCGGGQLVTQYPFGTHHNQRTTHGANRLTTQQMEYLRRGRGDTDMSMLFGTRLQEALNARRCMFGALPFVPVGEQDRQAAQTTPLVLTTGDELVDNYLGTIGKIAELRFPDYQTFGGGGGVAILKREHRFFR